MIFATPGKDGAQIIKMLGPFMRKTHHVIHENLEGFIYEVMEDETHQPLVSDACILEYKGHCFISEGTRRSGKGHFVTVFMRDLDLVVPKEAIHQGHDFESSSSIDDLIDER